MIKKQEWLNKYDRIIYTGMIDEFYNYCFGELEYRSLTFVHEHLPIDSFQGNAVVNYIDKNALTHVLSNTSILNSGHNQIQ